MWLILVDQCRAGCASLGDGVANHAMCVAGMNALKRVIAPVDDEAALVKALTEAETEYLNPGQVGIHNRL